MADDMFRPPIRRGMQVLDRASFNQTFRIKAARIFDNKNITALRSQLERSKDALQLERLQNIQPDPDPALANAGRKCMLLRTNDAQTDCSPSHAKTDTIAQPHSPILTELAKQGTVSIIPYDLDIPYSYWTYHDIITAILPEDEQGEIPSGFSQVGHVAHLNLRDEYLKHKHLIAEILVDKNPGVTTVINKIDDVGEESEFRTFKYEVLAGEDDLRVLASSQNCTFKFDYSKVYWNPRLNTEHARIVSMFKEGEAVCDVMAGIGPFAVPAGKKGVFVWANDLNPESFGGLQDAIRRNKVGPYVRPFNEDGRIFIRKASADLAKTRHQARKYDKPTKQQVKLRQSPTVTIVEQPKTFRHFVLNLPASALTFLPSFVGLYPLEVRVNLPGSFEMPLVHVYCFNTKSDDNVEEGIKICEEISQHLGFTLKPGKIADGGVEVHDVRDVAPKKRMFCASFRLPREVAFRDKSG